MILVDTHVLIWLRAVPERLTPAARRAIDGATQLAMSDITFWEIAVLARKDRITIDEPLRVWLDDIARTTRALPITPAVANAAAELPRDFPTDDPADKLIYATSRVHGIPLVSSDRRLRNHDPEVIWS